MVTVRRGSAVASLIVSFAMAVWVACSGDGGTPPPVPTVLVRVSGDGQSAQAGQPVTNALVVRVNDAQGRGVGGVAVTFSVTQGGGSVGAGSVTTGSDGQASVSWTVGTTAGSTQEVRAQVTSLTPVSFSATVIAGPAANIVLVSGDGQQSPQSNPLPQPLVVRVTDQYGNAVSGRAVTWAVVTGGGSVSPAASSSQANGQAQTTWTLGSVGPQTAEATASGLIGSPVQFGATALVLALTSVSPDTLVEGQAATLTGDGFDPTPANNTVMVGGVAATVTAATATTLSITVPTYDCQPARDVGVQVTVGAGTTSAITKRVHPAAFAELAVGEQVIIQDPAQFCAQFRPSATGGDSYLIGLSAAAEMPTQTLSFTLSGTAGAPTATAPSAVAAVPNTTGTISAIGSRDVSLQVRHGPMERRLREAERELLRRIGPRAATSITSASALRAAAAVPNVGDTLHVRVITDLNDPCGAFTEIDAVVRSVGQHSIWATDVIHPATDSLTDSDIDGFRAAFDANAYPTDTAYFGVPSDIDNNLRVTVVLSPGVNQSGIGLAYTFSGDLVSRSDCASSNEGEYFYHMVPDPTGSVGEAIQRADIVDFMPPGAAHEFTHVIQFSRRLFDPSFSTFQSDWESEGQATFAEEVVGHATLGNQVGQNYGTNVVNQGAGPIWYQQQFLLLGTYFGWDPFGGGRVVNAPERCTLFAYDDATIPCYGAHFYGTSFSIHRFVSDRFGPTYPGGEKQLHRDLIGAHTTLFGRANFEAVLGVDFDSVFAQWAAMLYVDGRVAGAAPEIQLTSWNLASIFSSYNANLQLTPLERTFAGFSDTRQVRAGSTAYTRVASTSARGALAVRARTSTGGILGGTLLPQLWIVRLQ